ncbi:sugar transferase, partial [Sphingomonas sp. CCH9-F2]|uniref:sugar transferase n=1 Tax=Sphingomonas sp. CCH9-F2 TaxID=1768778 RepID=UPI000AF2832E
RGPFWTPIGGPFWTPIDRAQINQGHVADVSDVKEKLNLDFYYVKNFSLWLDLLIILRTAQTMVTGKGAR